jgi:hypothetical protein
MKTALYKTNEFYRVVSTVVSSNASPKPQTIIWGLSLPFKRELGNKLFYVYGAVFNAENLDDVVINEYPLQRLQPYRDYLPSDEVLTKPPKFDIRWIYKVSTIWEEFEQKIVDTHEVSFASSPQYKDFLLLSAKA